MSLAEQINYYHSAPPKIQYIISLFAFHVHGFNLTSIYHVSHNYKENITQKSIKETIDECRQKGIIHENQKSHFIHADFLVSIYPFITKYKKERSEIISRSYYYFLNGGVKSLENYLNALFNEPSSIPRCETIILEANDPIILSSLFLILEQSEYRPVINLISKKIIAKSAQEKVNKSILELEPLNAFKSFHYDDFFSISSMEYFFKGDFENSLSSMRETDESKSLFLTALQKFLKESNVSESLILFEKGLKKQRTEVKGSQLPMHPVSAFYYLIALLKQDPDAYTPVLAKMVNSLEKKLYTNYDAFFIMMCYHMQNKKNYVKNYLLTLQQYILLPENQFFSLLSIITLYFVDYTLQDNLQEAAYIVVEKAYTNGYEIIALECAYALSKWWKNDKEIQDLYEKIREKVGFEPGFARIRKQEEWEKTLNFLLGLTGNKKAENKDEASKDQRIIYYINLRHNEIQPVLQKQLAKGGWSSGRNIALKTFQAGNIEGMTEQDCRVAKYVYQSNSGFYYGGSEYYFKIDAFKELIGHPYLFLSGMNNIPIEFIEGEPIIHVNKIQNGYKIQGNLNEVDEKITIVKETNTRYKIFCLNEIQRKILKTINEQKLIVPEKGKDTLSKILSNFSSQLTVHSDLIHAESQEIRTVETDSRIRVQLLPSGSGLKAELFAKPFGNHPPYCKPGHGGKILLYNQQGEQMQVSRDLKKETEFANLLISEIQLLENIDTHDELIAFDNPLDSLQLLSILEKYQDIAIVEWPEGQRYTIKKNIDFSNLKLKIKNVNNWFELQGDVQVDENTVITIQQLLELTAKGHNRFIELKKGEFLALSNQLKKQLDELNSFSKIGKAGIQINKFASTSMNGFFDELEDFKTDKAWKDFQKKINQAKKDKFNIPSDLQTELRPYQEEGFKWLARLAEWEAGACLADDMGLGKTIQSLSILLHRASLGPAMVIAPVSVIPNWINEIKKFAPTLNIKTLSNTNRQQIIDSLEPGDLLVTSYGLLQSEEELLGKTKWATLILDEAHNIKNYTTKTSKAAMLMDASFKLALTGTPIQNHLGEIWNLFNFINPGLLGTLQHFNEKFIKPEGDVGRKHLKKLIAPFILRRTKTSVLDELPPKTEITKKIQLSPEEMSFYETLRRQAIANLENDNSGNGAQHIKALAEITRLRQACCNPILVNADIKIPSTKLATFMEIVSELKENNHRALVFSQFVTHLNIVRKSLDEAKIAYQYLDGSTPISDREKFVKKFQSGEGGDLFLISLKAGGLGLNLTAADYVIHLDPWWNPAIEDQASDRAHRIGQSRPVTVYRLVAENTIEEKIIHLHNTKRDLADSLLEGTDKSGKMSTKELLNLITEV